MYVTKFNKEVLQVDEVEDQVLLTSFQAGQGRRRKVKTVLVAKKRASLHAVYQKNNRGRFPNFTLPVMPPSKILMQAKND